MKFDSAFKKAISFLSSEEKDKLILRLLKKDLPLANRLYFELVSGESVDEKRTEMEFRVKKMIEDATATYSSPGYLLLDLRTISAGITEHLKMTKDKQGEVSLNLLMLNEALAKNNKVLLASTPQKTSTLNTYIVARSFKLLMLIKAMDEDYLIEFKESLRELAHNFGNNPHLMHTAIFNGFDPNWFARIPPDIAEIYREMRDAGYLR